jgi:hypothetical protein
MRKTKRINLCIGCNDNKPMNERSSFCESCFDRMMNTKLKENSK